jgi:hypothetical protein
MMQGNIPAFIASLAAVVPSDNLHAPSNCRHRAHFPRATVVFYDLTIVSACKIIPWGNKVHHVRAFCTQKSIVGLI